MMETFLSFLLLVQNDNNIKETVVGCLRRADLGVVFENQVKPGKNKKSVRRARDFFGLPHMKISQNLAITHDSAPVKQYFGGIKKGVRTGAYFFFIFEPLRGFDPPMARTKAVAGAITEIHCSIVADMSINSSKMHLGSILMNSAVRHNNCGKIGENTLTVSQSSGSS